MRWLHAHNPLDWYPWGEEAFQKALKENKPIFLSIGYPPATGGRCDKHSKADAVMAIEKPAFYMQAWHSVIFYLTAISTPVSIISRTKGLSGTKSSGLKGIGSIRKSIPRRYFINLN